MYYNKNALPESLPAKEHQELLTRLKIDKDTAARDLLAEHNLRLVQTIVNRHFSNTQLDSDDLFSIGTIGLMKGIDTFDINKNIKLAT